MADSRFTLRYGDKAPGVLGETIDDKMLKQYELGYASSEGIIYSKDSEGNLTIVAQELKYGKVLPVNGVQGQIFYLLED